MRTRCLTCSFPPFCYDPCPVPPSINTRLALTCTTGPTNIRSQTSADKSVYMSIYASWYVWNVSSDSDNMFSSARRLLLLCSYAAVVAVAWATAMPRLVPSRRADFLLRRGLDVDFHVAPKQEALLSYSTGEYSTITIFFTQPVTPSHAAPSTQLSTTPRTNR